MKRRKKKIFCLLLIICLVLPLTVVNSKPVEAANFRDGDWLYQKISNGTISIQKYLGTDENVVIPEYFKEGMVTQISSRAFWNNTAIKTVTIPTLVVSIGLSAFEGCTSLETVNVEIGNAMSYIGPSAFKDCTNLVDVEDILTRDVRQINSSVFSGCSSLEEIYISGRVTNIESSAFFGMTNLKRITVDSSNIYFSQDSMGRLYNYTKTKLIKYPQNNSQEKYVMPDTVTTIERYACYNSKINDIEWSDNLKTIGDSAFFRCKDLESISIPNSVEEIGMSAFADCVNLKRIELPDMLKEIGRFAFENCAIKSIYLPANLQTMDGSAFLGCEELADIAVDGENGCYVTKDGILLSKDETKLICYPKAREDIKYYIPDGIVEVGAYALASAKSLEYVDIPKTITTLGDACFAETNLKVLDIPDNVTNIVSTTYNYLKSLEVLKLPNGMTVFDSTWVYAHDIYVPATVTSIILHPEPTDDYMKDYVNKHYYVVAGSYAEQHAVDYGIEYDYYQPESYEFDKYDMKIYATNGSGTLGVGKTMGIQAVLYNNGNKVEDWAHNFSIAISDNSILSQEEHDEDENLYGKSWILTGLKEGITTITVTDTVTGATAAVDIMVNQDAQTYLASSISNEGYLCTNDMFIDEFENEELEDGRVHVTFNVYNWNYSSGIIEVYDSENNLKNIEFIDGTKNVTSVWNVTEKVVSLGKEAGKWVGGDLKSYARESLCQHTAIDIIIPKGGKILITNDVLESDILYFWNEIEKTIEFADLTHSIITGLNKKEEVKQDAEKKLMEFFREKSKDETEKIITEWKANSHSVSKKQMAIYMVKDFVLETEQIKNENAKNFLSQFLDSKNFVANTVDELTDILPTSEYLSMCFTMSNISNIVQLMWDSEKWRGSTGLEIDFKNGLQELKTNDVTVSGDMLSGDKNYVLRSYQIQSGTEEYEKIKETVDAICSNAVIYNIRMLTNGKDADIEGKLEVALPIPEKFKTGTCKVYWIKEDGTVQDMNAVIRDNQLVFTTTHFSIYMIAGELEDSELVCEHKNTHILVKEATCTNDGKKQEICNDCSAVVSEVILPATGHSYSSYKITKQNTESESGILEIVCNKCNAVIENKISPFKDVKCYIAYGDTEIGNKYPEGKELTFTAIGEGMNNFAPGMGEIRYCPITYSINSQDYKWNNSDYNIVIKTDKAQTYEIVVTYVMEVYNGTAWETSDIRFDVNKKFDVEENINNSQVNKEQESLSNIARENTQKEADTIKTQENSKLQQIAKTGDINTNYIILILATMSIAGVTVISVNRKNLKKRFVK